MSYFSFVTIAVVRLVSCQAYLPRLANLSVLVSKATPCIGIRCLLALLIVLACQLAAADPQSKSFSRWSFSGQVATVRFSVAALDANQLAATRRQQGAAIVLGEIDWLADHLRQTVAVSQDGKVCPLENLRQQAAAKGYFQMRLQFRCRQKISHVMLRIESLQDIIPGHIHFATMLFQPEFESSAVLSTGSDYRELAVSQAAITRAERLFTPGSSIQLISMPIYAQSEPTLAVFTTYVELGFEHIVTGYDHLLFLLALLMLVARRSQILWLVTGFTVGHSITLAVAALGVFTPPGLAIESLIGFSIVLLAVENEVAREGNNESVARAAALMLLLLTAYSMWTTAFSKALALSSLSLLGLALFVYCYFQLASSRQSVHRHRPWVTLLFGLLHGFGFAGILLEVGVPESSRVSALLGFNLGVEIGQLACVALVLALAALSIRLVSRGLLLQLRPYASAAIAAVGSYWFVQRLFL